MARGELHVRPAASEDPGTERQRIPEWSFGTKQLATGEQQSNERSIALEAVVN